MKILLINKFHFPAGGADRHYALLGEELTAAGHEVFYAAQAVPADKLAFKPKLSVEFPIINFKLSIKEIVSAIKSFQVKSSRATLANVGQIVSSCFYNGTNRRLIDEFLKHQKIDVVHIHNIYHQISASILPVIKRHKLPIIQTVHDYHLVSPIYTGWAQKKSDLPDVDIDAEIQNFVLPGAWTTWTNRLVQNNLLATTLEVLSFLFEHHYYKLVDHFLVATNFVAQQLIKTFRQTPITVKPLPINTSDLKPINQSHDLRENIAVWIGRPDTGKGSDLIPLLADALPPNWRLIAIGLTPEKHHGFKLQAIGSQTPAEIDHWLRRAKVCLIPSLYPETFSLVATEAIAAHCPILLSNRGALAETAQAQSSGHSPFGQALPPPEDPASIALWQERLSQLEIQPLNFNSELANLWIEQLNPKNYTAGVLEIYTRLIENKK